MGVLSDHGIWRAVDRGDLELVQHIRGKPGEVEPLPRDSTLVRGNSLDLQLGNVFYVHGPRRYLRYGEIDTAKPIPDDLYERHVVEDGDRFWTEPGDLIIACVKQRIAFKGELMGLLTGRSSLARLGIEVHKTAGHFDRGFQGWPTLEISNGSLMRISLIPGKRVASMLFFTLDTAALMPYGGRDSKYQNQGPEPVLSRIHLDAD